MSRSKCICSVHFAISHDWLGRIDFDLKKLAVRIRLNCALKAFRKHWVCYIQLDKLLQLEQTKISFGSKGLTLPDAKCLRLREFILGCLVLPSPRNLDSIHFPSI